MTGVGACHRCDSDDVVYLGAHWIECLDCELRWNAREWAGLDPNSCEACGRRLSFGCGHSIEQEHAAIAERQTIPFRSGATWHYDHSQCLPEACELAGSTIPGYAAIRSHREQARRGDSDLLAAELFVALVDTACNYVAALQSGTSPSSIEGAVDCMLDGLRENVSETMGAP